MCSNNYLDLCRLFLCEPITFKDGSGAAILASVTGNYTFYVRSANNRNIQKKVVTFTVGDTITTILDEIATPLVPLRISIKTPNSAILPDEYTVIFDICTTV